MMDTTNQPVSLCDVRYSQLKIQEFNDYCSSLAATTNVIQWGNASVWKVGGKIFAICSHLGDGIEIAIDGIGDAWILDFQTNNFPV